MALIILCVYDFSAFPVCLTLLCCHSERVAGSRFFTDWVIDGGLATEMASSERRRFANLADNNIKLSVRVILAAFA